MSCFLNYSATEAYTVYRHSNAVEQPLFWTSGTSTTNNMQSFGNCPWVNGFPALAIDSLTA